MRITAARPEMPLLSASAAEPWLPSLSVDPAVVWQVTRILKNARAMHEDVCDPKREAQRMHAVFNLYAKGIGTRLDSPNRAPARGGDDPYVSPNEHGLGGEDWLPGCC